MVSGECDSYLQFLRLLRMPRVEDIKGVSAAACGSSHSAFVSGGRCLVDLGSVFCFFFSLDERGKKPGVCTSIMPLYKYIYIYAYIDIRII